MQPPRNSTRKTLVGAVQESLLCSILTLMSIGAAAQQVGMDHDEPTSDLIPDEKREKKSLGSAWHYGNKGLEYEPSNSQTALWIGLRFQTRFDTLPGSLSTPDDLNEESSDDIDLRRGRIKGGGKLFADWLDVYSEYDFTSDTLLDYKITATFDDWLSFRAGQWKSEFSRERIDSSGKQQFVERSLANYWFTVDRQRGVAVSGRLARGTRADTRFYVEYLTGQGLGESFEGGQGLWLGRVMWNPSGRQLFYSQANLQRNENPVPAVAFAVISGRTPYTRYSSSGGGNLPGYQAGDFDLRQYLLETAVQFRGFSWQQELHLKEITDRSSGLKRDIVGGYAQVGSILNEWWPSMPSPLEVVGRFSAVDPDDEIDDNLQTEWMIGINWYFNGHRNKLTADYSWLDFDDPAQGSSRGRFRLQWELSL